MIWAERENVKKRVKNTENRALERTLIISVSKFGDVSKCGF
jgi:hypothetical protein